MKTKFLLPLSLLCLNTFFFKAIDVFYPFKNDTKSSSYKISQKEEQTGTPTVDFVSFSNGIGETDYFCTSHVGNSYEIYPKLSNTSHQIRLRKYPSLNIVYSSSTNYYGDSGTLNYTPSPGWYVLEVKRTNSYGTTDWVGYEVEFVDCSQNNGGGNEYRVYPNPTSEILIVEESSKSKTQNNKTHRLNKINSSSTYELYDFNSTLVSRGKINDITNIDISNYKKGEYILKINSKGKSKTHHVIIE